MRKLALLWCLLVMVVSTGLMAEERGLIAFPAGELKPLLAKGFPYENFAYTIAMADKPPVGETKEYSKKPGATLSDLTVVIAQEVSPGQFFDACMKDTEFGEVTLDHPLGRNSALGSAKIVLLKVKITAVDLENTHAEMGQHVKLTLSYQGMRISYFNAALKQVGTEVKLGQ